jgi:hypothetical protein
MSAAISTSIRQGGCCYVVIALTDIDNLRDVHADTAELIRCLGLEGIEQMYFPLSSRVLQVAARMV